jgi:hypothetical protein
MLGEGLDLINSSHFSFKQRQLHHVKILVEVRDLIQILGLNFNPKIIKDNCKCTIILALFLMQYLCMSQ